MLLPKIALVIAFTAIMLPSSGSAGLSTTGTYLTSSTTEAITTSSSTSSTSSTSTTGEAQQIANEQAQADAEARNSEEKERAWKKKETDIAIVISAVCVVASVFMVGAYVYRRRKLLQRIDELKLLEKNSKLGNVNITGETEADHTHMHMRDTYGGHGSYGADDARGGVAIPALFTPMPPRKASLLPGPQVSDTNSIASLQPHFVAPTHKRPVRNAPLPPPQEDDDEETKAHEVEVDEERSQKSQQGTLRKQPIPVPRPRDQMRSPDYGSWENERAI
eukprot:m.13491 g.13491  ORF g.13491 m.13491 type:complete len:277 (-) comp9748_c0_seq1:175-1005(-)